MIRTLLLAAVLVGVPISAVAADGDSSTSMAACRVIKTDAERLACYDHLARLLPSGVRPDTVSAEPLVVAPPQAAAPMAKTITETGSSFGAEAVRKPKSDEPTMLAAKVVGAVDGVRRDQIFLLDNGQRWRVLSDNESDYTANGPTARIERNLIGTYWMRLGDQGPSFKVRRVQ